MHKYTQFQIKAHFHTILKGRNDGNAWVLMLSRMTMMQIKMKHNEITCIFPNTRTKSGESHTLISAQGLLISPKELRDLLEVFHHLCGRWAIKTQLSTVHTALIPLIKFLRHSKKSWPYSSTEWQMLLLDFQRYYLLNTHYSSASTHTRIRNWNKRVITVLRFFADETLIPFDVVIPLAKTGRHKILAKPQPLLGIKQSQISKPEEPVRKLLVDISTAQCDADYLDAVEQDCSNKIKHLKRTCLKHWAWMQKDHHLGDRMASCISSHELKQRLRNDNPFTATTDSRDSVRQVPVTCSSLADGLHWSLAIVQHLLVTGTDFQCISTQRLYKTRFFNKAMLNRYRQELFERTAMSVTKSSHIQSTWMLYRLAGILSPVDIACACALLTIEQPSFTPESLVNAKLLNVQGHSYLLQTDVEGKQIFSLDKPRAGCRKSTVLSPISKKIITTIITCTQPIRDILRSRGNPAWQYLFLGFNRGGELGRMRSNMTEYLTGKRSTSLLTLYPSLKKQGLERGSLDFTRIRNTMGILEWFKTGSIRALSKKLGNSQRVALEHYIPPALLHAWNTRLVRRFQQLLIVLAAHDEDHLLQISDFSSLADLTRFITQLLLDYPAGSSPVASEIHHHLSRFNHAPENEVDMADSVLHLRLSEHSLGLLYAFSEWASQHDYPCQTKDIKFQVQYLIELSTLIKHACETDKHSLLMREILAIESLRNTHSLALKQQATYTACFKQFTLSKSWGEVR